MLKHYVPEVTGVREVSTQDDAPSASEEQLQSDVDEVDDDGVSLSRQGVYTRLNEVFLKLNGRPLSKSYVDAMFEVHGDANFRMSYKDADDIYQDIVEAAAKRRRTE